MTHDVVPAPGTLLTGRLVLPDEVVPDGAVVLDGPTIVYAGPRAGLPGNLGGVPMPVGWPMGQTLLPGLVDIHCHGGDGGEFGADVDASRVAAAHHHRCGTTTVVASLVSQTRAGLVGGIRTGAALVADGTVAGVHLEGPFLSYRYRGAQNPDALRDVDYSLLDDLVQAAGATGVIAQMTFAPERDAEGALPPWLARHGITPAIGHTGASVGRVRAALDAAATSLGGSGRPLVTHVFNGMPPLHHREPGPVAAALAAAARGLAVLEVISDGVHLAPETVSLLFDLVGPERIALVTDAMAACGLPDGGYTLGGRAVQVSDGTARLVEGGSIAGGTATLLDVVRYAVRVAGVPLLDAVRAASVTPATVLRLCGAGRLVAGARADLVVVDEGLTLSRSMRSGRWL